MRTIKKNFWKSFLFSCVGLIVATIVFAAGPFYEPSSPGEPLIVDYNEYSCSIKFLRPVSDGGLPIIKYIVEEQEKESNRWGRKGTYNGFGDDEVIRCIVERLSEGKTYCFRAIAVNAAGPSKPSRPSAYVTIKKR